MLNILWKLIPDRVQEIPYKSVSFLSCFNMLSNVKWDVNAMVYCIEIIVTQSRGSANEHDDILEVFMRIICKMIFWLHVLLALIVDDILYLVLVYGPERARCQISGQLKKSTPIFVLPSVTPNKISTSLKLLPISP